MGASPVQQIELRLRDFAQLFNSMDPTPFHHKDLDPGAEEFIESWALEFPPDSQFQITVHIQQTPVPEEATRLITEAIHNFFDYKAELARRELRRLFREGRVSLVIGLGFLAICLLAANAIGKVGSDTVLSIGRESLTIGGWVAMWRPIQIFLYDWWPLQRRRRTYHKLACAEIRVPEVVQART